MPTSLVTGGAGFIGSHVVDALVAMGHEVVVVDDLSGGFVENVNSSAIFLEGSCTDPVFVQGVFAQHRFDYVFHLAAYAAEGLSHFIRRFNYTNNLIGSANIINAAVNQGGVKALVFTSSIAVYGSSPPPVREETTPMPLDPYGIAKYAVELDLQAAQRMFGLNHIIFRTHNVYGERQNHGDRYRNVIGIFMNEILQGRPCGVFGDGGQTRAFTHIDDIAPAIARSIAIPRALNQVFNLGAETPYTVNHLACVVQEAMGRQTGIAYLDARDEVVHAFCDHAKAREILGYHSTVGLEAGIARMAVWVKTVGPRSSKPFEGIEVDRGLPPSWRAVIAGPPERPGP